jgi:hypothetical protein
MRVANFAVAGPHESGDWQSLDSLTTPQIIDRVRVHVQREDADAFALLVDGLSPRAVRVLAARALVRLRTSDATP